MNKGELMITSRKTLQSERNRLKTEHKSLYNILQKVPFYERWVQVYKP